MPTPAEIRAVAGCDGGCSCEIWTRHDAAMALYNVTPIVQAARAWADAHNNHARGADMRKAEAALLLALDRSSAHTGVVKP